jgi:hypothetical protein
MRKPSTRSASRMTPPRSQTPGWRDKNEPRYDTLTPLPLDVLSPSYKNCQHIVPIRSVGKKQLLNLEISLMCKSHLSNACNVKSCNDSVALALKAWYQNPRIQAHAQVQTPRSRLTDSSSIPSNSAEARRSNRSYMYADCPLKPNQVAIFQVQKFFDVSVSGPLPFPPAIPSSS